MRVLLLMRGAMGCGKSTFIEQNGLKPYTLCADDIRLLCQAPVLGTDGNYCISQKNEKVVWQTLFNILEVRMKRGEFTVIDATNTKTSEMNRYKDLAKKYRYRIYCVDMTDVPMNLITSMDGVEINLRNWISKDDGLIPSVTLSHYVMNLDLTNYVISDIIYTH